MYVGATRLLVGVTGRGERGQRDLARRHVVARRKHPQQRQAAAHEALRADLQPRRRLQHPRRHTYVMVTKRLRNVCFLICGGTAPGQEAPA